MAAVYTNLNGTNQSDVKPNAVFLSGSAMRAVFSFLVNIFCEVQVVFIRKCDKRVIEFMRNSIAMGTVCRK